MRTSRDEIERGEARFLLLPTFTLVALAVGVYASAEVENRVAGAAGLAAVALLTGGMALVKWALYARVTMGEEGVTLRPRWWYGVQRDFRWDEVSSWREELYSGPNDEDGPASHRLVIERAGKPTLLLPEHWRSAIGEELKRRLPLLERGASPRPVPGPEKTTAIRT